VHGDLAETARLTADNSYQQRRIDGLEAAFDRYMANLEMTLARGAERDRALAMTADVTRVSVLVTEMRDHEDGLLTQRIGRADAFFTVLLPTLGFSVAVIAYLVVFVGRSIARALREGEIVLSEKDGELAAKDIMMREIDHRVRNSLNLIYNLMLLQQRRTADDSAACGLLREAANQILVVARVHERLYKYGSMQAVELGEYLQNLCTDVANIALPAEARAAIQLNAAHAEVRAEEAIWLGLIVVELVTNAVKYGSPSLQTPITIDVSPDERQCA
jgi:two-component sensor histidine kinase